MATHHPARYAAKEVSPLPARRILQLGDPLLRDLSTPVTELSVAAAILDDLRDSLHEFQCTHGFGRGISAVQIGALQRIIYMEVDGFSYSLINPRYEYMSAEKFRLWDDCFSFPDLLVWLERSQTVCIRYANERGADQILHAAGPLSELVQHEMDHLDGILAIDRALDKNSICTRRMAAPLCLARAYCVELGGASSFSAGRFACFN